MVPDGVHARSQSPVRTSTPRARGIADGGCRPRPASAYASVHEESEAA